MQARLARPSDAEAFAQWALNNPDIPAADIDAVANSTALTIVVEADGQPELYIPYIFSETEPLLTIGYLGFRPGPAPRTKAKALKAILAATHRLQDHFDCKVRVVTEPEYPMGKWALKHGFIQKPDGFYLEKR